ncbi:MAG TPA: type II toxin-antitoxin system VapC family toxin [Desulfuromonadales bacterium]|nr:type II toxin-antitoxin system VapC family toxin [Desulfuromonadales bacterium]
MEWPLVYLIDTNIIIYYLEGEHAAVSFLRTNRGKLAISFITWMETLSFPFSADEEQVVRAFLQEFRLIEISSPVMELSVEIRRKKKLKLPDAIIAASAIHHDLILVTRDCKDFKGTSVKTLDPFLVS